MSSSIRNTRLPFACLLTFGLSFTHGQALEPSFAAGQGGHSRQTSAQEPDAETAVPPQTKPESEQRADLERHLQAAQGAVRPLLLYDERGKLQRQVGAFRVAEDSLLTAAAVLRGASRAAWELSPELTLPVKGVSAIDRERGMALLQLDLTGAPEELPRVLEPKHRGLRTGPLLGAVGITLTMSTTYNIGRLTGVVELPGLGRLGRADGLSEAGLEGGPVLATDGALVGVLGELVGDQLRSVIPVACLQDSTRFEPAIQLTLALPMLHPRVLAGRRQVLAGQANQALADLAGVGGPEASFWRGCALAITGQPDAAIEALETAMEGSESVPAHLVLASQLGAIGKTAEAFSTTRQAIDLAPKSPAPRFGMALLFQSIGKDTDALQSLRQALNRNEQHVRALALRGEILLGRLRLKEAQPCFDQALAIDPYSSEALAGYGRLLLELDQPEPAMAFFQRALDVDPDLPQGHLLLARSNMELERNEAAMVHVRKALEIDPRSAEAYEILGDLLVAMNRHEDSLEPYESATILGPDRISGHLALGQSLKHLRRFHDALVPLNKALGLEPRNPTALFNAGFCYLMIGERGKARDNYKVLQHIDGRAARLLYELIYDK